MNKKAMFFSLSVVLFLLFLLIIFNNQSKIREEEVKSYVERAQLIVMDNFVRDFDQYYAQQILETAAKHALVEKSKNAPFTENELVTAMNDDTIIVKEATTGNNFNQSLGTLAFAIPEGDRDFSYSIDTISQPSFDKIEIKFLVDYWFTVFDTKWSKYGKLVTVEFPVLGITHPKYSPGVIDDTWDEDGTPCVDDCLLFNLMGISCGGSINNIIPPYESC